MSTFSVVGLPDPAVVEFLESGTDLCFGKYFAKSTHECIICRAPVVMDKKLYLMKEVCAMKCTGNGSVAKLNRLTAREIMERLERGATLASIFREILGSASPDLMASAARQLLVDRMVYLKTVGFDPGPIPRTKDLLGETK